jgi:drug/metabolite transporter (DMT)-like permease
VIALLLAAASALVWGTGDFCGGKASQRADSLHVSVVVALVGVPLAIGAVIVTTPAAPGTADLLWGAGAGVAGFVGLVLFYRALAAGAMSVTAPTTAMVSALVPLLAGLVFDRAPGTLALIGAGLAVVAVGLVSVGRDGGGPVRGGIVVLAAVAGVLFGLFFVGLKQASPAVGMWPLLAARIGGLAVGGLVLARRGDLPRLGRVSLRWALVAGVFDVAANALYLLAAYGGPLSVVGPIASLYPASTVVLAVLVDGERLRPVQVAGLGMALAALVLTAGY